MNTINKFKITTDLKSRSCKPNKEELGAISNSMSIVTEVTLEEFNTMMNDGFTWSPAIFNGTRNNANWIQQQVFALDFDNGITPNEVLSKFNAFSITPNVLYTTFSDSDDCRKFRVVFVLDSVIKEQGLREYIQKGLMNLVGNSDASCKDSARMFFGGKVSTIISSSEISLEVLLQVIDCDTIAKDRGQTRKLCEKVKSYYINNIEDNILTQKEEIQHFDFKKLENQILIFKDFINGKWLTHPQLFGLATSLHWIKGGIKLMKTTMNKFNLEGKTSYTPNNFAILTYVKFRNYNPQKLKNYSPYETDWYHTNCITAVRNIRGYIERVEEERPKISLKEAEALMKKSFNEILTAKDTNIYIMRLSTGIGKTRLLETIPHTIALPTNQLKDEVYERVLVRKTKTPTFPNLINQDLYKKINHFYYIGMDKMATKLINKIAKNPDKYGEDSVSCKTYLSDLKKAYNSKDCVVTTHNRAVYSEFKSDTVIFDEDPLFTILNHKKLNISDLINIEARTKNQSVTDLINYLRVLPQGILTKTPRAVLELGALIEDNDNADFVSDLTSISESDYLLKDSRDANIFNYIQKRTFLENKKIVIMSATIPVEIYKALYGDRVKVIDITNVEQVGKIIQNTGRSYSRESIKKDIERITNTINTNLPTITFKQFAPQIPNGVQDIYYGNVSGYDRFKGKDINVVGTPHLNNVTYALIGKAIGINVKNYDFSYRKVTWSGFRFEFNCYDNDDLMKVQLSLIESELIQAVGRNRTLREDCITYVYSNFPLYVTTTFVR